MRIAPLFALLALIPSAASGQTSYPALPGVQITDVTSAIASAAPPICAAAPLPDAFSAVLGTGTPCLKRPDDQRPTQVQPVRTTTASDGSFSVAWPNQTLFTSAPTYVHAEILGGAAPYQCDVISVSTTTVTGKCYMLIATTLPLVATSLLGLVLSPFTTPGAGLTVMVIGRQ